MLQSSQLFQLTSSRREWREHPTQQRSRVMHFNSHPHEEDDEADCSSGVAAIVFQLTSSRRGWLVREAFIYYTSHFNSHPHEEDDNVHWWRCCISEISTHILTKRMTGAGTTQYVLRTFQLTSSRRGWQLCCARGISSKCISTHILTKRMTCCKWISSNIVAFQLTSSRRGWPYPVTYHLQPWYFNSHPHEEDDPCFFINQCFCNFISTHILTKRMT